MGHHEKDFFLMLCDFLLTPAVSLSAWHGHWRHHGGSYYDRHGSWAPLAGLFMFSLANMSCAQQINTLENKIDELISIIETQSKRIKELETQLEKVQKGRVI